MITFYEVYTLDLRCKTEAQVKREIMGYFMCCSGAKVHSFIAVAMKNMIGKALIEKPTVEIKLGPTLPCTIKPGACSV